ncbi:CPBP family intramembrane metalloprotease [Aldersonia sp. NBC_00410]|uniref:CPBP family intramembrane glutamic endopeptidase n=1 Tax=Aldersonia sp. NBC_00410 TaxID=2975954 RepID=UPI002250FF58|nr:CPBP family intramembrane glutamic endopeptidase [Aldersonia sp. NBC_00410]MCX5045134.1 CPBP family intramembrane metalloprotease [Aldersonia sp. NBC_00410]
MDRRATWFEIGIVLVVTFGLSGLNSMLSLVEDALQAGGLSDQTVALNQSRSTFSLIDLLFQLLSILRLAGWAALGLYLLWRSGIGPAAIGLARKQLRRDLLPGLVLAAVIGLPGLAFYLIAHALGMNLTVQASALGDHWWRVPVLILAALANAAAEEILVVGYLVTRLRGLGWSENKSLAASALLRGSYHLYQGLGGGLGNMAMGVVFGRYWQVSNRLWPLIIAHALIDIVAFVGYTLLREHVGWLP